MAGDDAGQRGSVMTTVLLALAVFGVGAAAGFVARLLWPHTR